MSEFHEHEKAAITYPISVASAASATVIPAVAGKRFVVTYYKVETAANNTFKFQSDTTDITGAITTAANTPVEAGNGGSPILTGRGTNEALKIVISTSGDATGWVVATFQNNEEYIPT